MTIGRFAVEQVTPAVACGELPAKAVVGERVPVGAVCYRDGHEALGVNVVWQGPDTQPGPFTRMSPTGAGTDHYEAYIRPDSVGMWQFTVEAFGDPYLSWRGSLGRKLAAGQGAAELANDLASGVALLHRAEDAVPAKHAGQLAEAAAALADGTLPLPVRTLPALELAELLWQHPLRELVTSSPPYQIWVDRRRALFSAWYEMFPRSQGARVSATGKVTRHGSLATAARSLPRIARMGFDVVYLPPIHPIGQVNRKGRDNALTAQAGDVGSPWAIGSAEGGHDAIHPKLGTEDDLRAFVARARKLGLEVALDLALQCAPDHPWVSAHPEWFNTGPDGSIAHAQNPPKTYEDIYPLNFDSDPVGLREEILRVVRHWTDLGIRVFRVDNPHTKPIDFWHWLIWTVKQDNPDVLFLAEAFTRPAVMHGLAAVGFTQSYTYFTWRETATELREYCQELVASAWHMRPNFWPNTPDILPEHLQHGGPPMFKVRAVLASLLSPSWGVYSGYELYENAARPGAQEYLDNEKFQLRPRDFAAAARDGESLEGFLARLNAIRRENPALHWLRNLHFHDVDNEALLCWSKRDDDSNNTVLVVCSVDPSREQWGNVTVDLPSLGFDRHDRILVCDELSGERYDWGGHNVVRLDPDQPAHVFTVHRHTAAEAA